jgi:hypothetical protein
VGLNWVNPVADGVAEHVGATGELPQPIEKGVVDRSREEGKPGPCNRLEARRVSAFDTL